MIPKKIYLNPKTLAGLSPTNGEGKTMRVKTFGFYRAFDCAKIPDHEVLAWLYLIDIPTTK